MKLLILSLLVTSGNDIKKKCKKLNLKIIVISCGKTKIKKDINLQEGQKGREKFLRRSKKRRHLPKIWTEKCKDRPTDSSRSFLLIVFF